MHINAQDLFEASLEQLDPPLQPGEVVLRNLATGQVIRYASHQDYLRDNCELYVDFGKPVTLNTPRPRVAAEPNEAINRFRAMIRDMRG